MASTLDVDVPGIMDTYTDLVDVGAELNPRPQIVASSVRFVLTAKTPPGTCARSNKDLDPRLPCCGSSIPSTELSMLGKPCASGAQLSGERGDTWRTCPLPS